MWEYLHRYFETAEISEEKAFGFGMPKEVASRYDSEGLKEYLNRMSKEGWELFNMEPDWYYEQKNISGATAIARPLTIIGWFLTFKRQAS